MNDKQPQTALAVQKKRTVADLINGEKMRMEIAKVLPKHLTPERMTRVALTATMRNPQLMDCTPESLTNSLLICSQAGLEPDGRLAHLIPYWNSKKNAYECQVIFDYKGLVTLALRNGAGSVYADKVCEFDDFAAYVEDGRKKLNHRPNWSKPRGTGICYYAVCKRGDDVDWEVMTTDEVEAIRARSRAAKNGPWVTDFDEMAKKTVLRRMSKRWDLLPEIRDIINADDDTPPPFGQSTVSAPLFTPKVLPQAAAESAPEQQAPPEQDDSNPELMPVPQEPEQPAEPEEKPRQNYLKAVRLLCQASKVKEGELLTFLADIGTTDGSVTSLEELAMSDNNTLKLVHDQWSDISGKIIAARKGAK